MDIEEIRKLIPFYVSNSLDHDEREIVAEAIHSSKELQDELASWQKVSGAARSHARYLAEGHLTSEQIVDYAEHAVVDTKQKDIIENHLRSCDNCREEYDMIMETLAIPVYVPSLMEKVAQLFSSFKLVYAVPVAVTLVLVVVLWRNFTPGDSVSSFVLPYETSVVSRDKSSIPILELNDSMTSLHLVLTTPHDTHPTAKYVATLSNEKGLSLMLPDTLSKILAPDSPVDSMRMSVDTKSVKFTEGEWTLTLVEAASSLPEGAIPFLPKNYHFILRNRQ